MKVSLWPLRVNLSKKIKSYHGSSDPLSHGLLEGVIKTLARTSHPLSDGLLDYKGS